MKFSEVLQDPHFNNLAAIIRWPFRSQMWKQKHDKVEFWTRIKALDKANADPFDSRRWLLTLTDLLVAITDADPRLRYTTVDLDWMVAQMDGPHAATVASMFMAWFSAPDEMLTPAEIAKATDTAESTWRNKAATGHVPGSFKKGKQWLLPRSVVCSQIPEHANKLREAKSGYQEDLEEEVN